MRNVNNTDQVRYYFKRGSLSSSHLKQSRLVLIDSLLFATRVRNVELGRTHKQSSFSNQSSI